MHLHFFAKLFSISQFSFDHKTSNMSRIEELEPEYLDFIKRKEQTYGTPIVFTKPHSFDKLKAYIEAINDSWRYEAINIFSFVVCLPCVFLPYCIWINNKPDLSNAQARSVQSYRYILFPTMVVKLEKLPSGEVMDSVTLSFEQFDEVETVWVDDVNQNER